MIKSKSAKRTEHKTQLMRTRLLKLGGVVYGLNETIYSKVCFLYLPETFSREQPSEVLLALDNVRGLNYPRLIRDVFRIFKRRNYFVEHFLPEDQYIITYKVCSQHSPLISIAECTLLFTLFRTLTSDVQLRDFYSYHRTWGERVKVKNIRDIFSAFLSREIKGHKPFDLLSRPGFDVTQLDLLYDLYRDTIITGGKLLEEHPETCNEVVEDLYTVNSTLLANFGHIKSFTIFQQLKKYLGGLL